MESQSSLVLRSFYFLSSFLLPVCLRGSWRGLLCVCVCECSAALPVSACVSATVHSHIIWLCLCVNDSCKSKTSIQEVGLHSDPCPGELCDVRAWLPKETQDTSFKRLICHLTNSRQTWGETQDIQQGIDAKERKQNRKIERWPERQRQIE